jgi:hypothetical protein
VSKQAKAIKDWVPKVVGIVFTIISAVAAYAGAGATATDKASQVKDKSEAGYQYVEKWVKHFEDTDRVLNERIAKLEARLVDNERRAKLSAVKRKAEVQKPVPAPVALPPAPPPLPASLDKALEQAQAAKPVESGK